MRKFVQIALGTLVVAALSAPTAFANTISPDPNPVIGPLVGGSYLWTYNVSLEGDSTVETGDYFTIFDFGGFTGAGDVVSPAGWSFSSALFGPCTTGTVGDQTDFCNDNDDPTIANLTWTRTGTAIDGPADLGNFSARSIFNVPTDSHWISQDTDNQTGTLNEGASGGTNVPVATAVPEPASMLLLGAGLVGLAVRARRRVRS